MKRKYIRSLYWIRYDAGFSHIWIQLRDWSINPIAQRGRFVSGRISKDKRYKSLKPIVRFLSKIKHPKKLTLEYLLSNKPHISFVKSICCKTSLLKRLDRRRMEPKNC